MEITQYLIDHGADVNHTDEEKQTPLEIAICWGSLSDVKILIENEANVNTVMLKRYILVRLCFTSSRTRYR